MRVRRLRPLVEKDSAAPSQSIIAGWTPTRGGSTTLRPSVRDCFGGIDDGPGSALAHERGRVARAARQRPLRAGRRSARSHDPGRRAARHSDGSHRPTARRVRRGAPARRLLRRRDRVHPPAGAGHRARSGRRGRRSVSHPGRRVPAAYWPCAPDLAVEVVSPWDRPGEIRARIDDYFSAGARLVWLVEPDTATVRVHRSATDVEVIGADGDLDGSDVLPGFRCPVRRLFPALRPA
ncbi:MAG: Uma2 family endonuclease [Acidobacteria bacterium]|nr:Uma2 family endonuclease [Acidobacteriota bacterium]